MVRFPLALWSRLRRRLPGSTASSCSHRLELASGDQSTAPSTPIILSSVDVAKLPVESFGTRDRGNVSWQTLLSAPSTASNTFTVGVAMCRPETGLLAMHRHRQAEIYHIISGSGTVEMGGKKFDVNEGDVVFIPGDMEHGISNTGSRELKWLYCFAADGFQDVVYRFTNEEVKSG